MGKIKQKLVKNAAKNLLKEGIGFNEDFNKNKKILGSTMPSKKLRNQMAGYLSRVKRQDREEKEKLSIK